MRYWLGQWDDALAELSSDTGDDVPALTATFLHEGRAALLVHGVTALIAGCRDQRTRSRRTAQTHISHILAKLGARSRVDIVREALRQGISA